MPETESENIIDQLFRLLQQLLVPDWSDLIELLPWVLLALVVGYVLHTARQWRKAARINRSRVPHRLAAGAPPPGVHMPGPSRWPFVVPIGAALLLFAFALPSRDAAGNATFPVSLPLLVVGLIVTAIAVVGWSIDAMREWRATAHGEHGTPALATAGAAVLPAHGGSSLAHGGSSLAHGGSSLALRQASSVQVAERAFEYAEPPVGVHMPGPSPWPFFAPIAATVMLFGVIFSSVLIIGGLILGVIVAVGWLGEAAHEYRTTEQVGHAVPKTRDPALVWPRRLVPVFAVVIALSFLGALAPVGLGFLNGLTPPSAGPSAVAVPAVPEISASTALSFETSTLIVPCCREFDLVFKNKQAGVPHDVAISDSAARATDYFAGERVDGPAEVTYKVPAIPEGDYYFLCTIHPNMNGTLLSRPETGGSGGPGGSPGAPGAPAPSGAAPQP